MPSCQSAILPEPQGSALFLILRARDRVSSACALARAAARVPALANRVAAPPRSDAREDDRQRRRWSPRPADGFQRSVSGANFFVPSLPTLRALAR
jgi:hypothetical protein